MIKTVISYALVISASWIVLSNAVGNMQAKAAEKANNEAVHVCKMNGRRLHARPHFAPEHGCWFETEMGPLSTDQVDFFIWTTPRHVGVKMLEPMDTFEAGGGTAGGAGAI